MITSPADTLVCDSAQLAAFRSDAAYDYNRELITPEINIFEWIRGQFGELLGKYSVAVLRRSIPGLS